MPHTALYRMLGAHLWCKKPDHYIKLNYVPVQANHQGPKGNVRHSVQYIGPKRGASTTEAPHLSWPGRPRMGVKRKGSTKVPAIAIEASDASQCLS